MSCIEIQDELYKRKPYLKQHHQQQIERVKRMLENPADWDAIDRQIEQDFQTHHQINPNSLH